MIVGGIILVFLFIFYKIVQKKSLNMLKIRLLGFVKSKKKPPL